MDVQSVDQGSFTKIGLELVIRTISVEEIFKLTRDEFVQGVQFGRGDSSEQVQERNAQAQELGPRYKEAQELYQKYVRDTYLVEPKDTESEGLMSQDQIADVKLAQQRSNLEIQRLRCDTERVAGTKDALVAAKQTFVALVNEYKMRREAVMQSSLADAAKAAAATVFGQDFRHEQIDELLREAQENIQLDKFTISRDLQARLQRKLEVEIIPPLLGESRYGDLREVVMQSSLTAAAEAAAATVFGECAHNGHIGGVLEAVRDEAARRMVTTQFTISRDLQARLQSKLEVEIIPSCVKRERNLIAYRKLAQEIDRREGGSSPLLKSFNTPGKMVVTIEAMHTWLSRRVLTKIPSQGYVAGRVQREGLLLRAKVGDNVRGYREFLVFKMGASSEQAHAILEYEGRIAKVMTEFVEGSDAGGSASSSAASSREGTRPSSPFESEGGTGSEDSFDSLPSPSPRKGSAGGFIREFDRQLDVICEQELAEEHKQELLGLFVRLCLCQSGTFDVRPDQLVALKAALQDRSFRCALQTTKRATPEDVNKVVALLQVLCSKTPSPRTVVETPSLGSRASWFAQGKRNSHEAPEASQPKPMPITQTFRRFIGLT